MRSHNKIIVLSDMAGSSRRCLITTGYISVIAMATAVTVSSLTAVVFSVMAAATTTAAVPATVMTALAATTR